MRALTLALIGCAGLISPLSVTAKTFEVVTTDATELGDAFFARGLLTTQTRELHGEGSDSGAQRRKERHDGTSDAERAGEKRRDNRALLSNGEGTCAWRAAPQGAQ
jgi:hypothetical protein